MDASSYLRAILALLFVAGLIGLLAILVRKFGLDKSMVQRSSSNKRIAIEDSIMIGTRHRVVLVRNDDKEHLLLLGPHGDRVIETTTKKETIN